MAGSSGAREASEAGTGAIAAAATGPPGLAAPRKICSLQVGLEVGRIMDPLNGSKHSMY
jgi:hypothetical protein